tara:strand:- start:960 stop:1919 length:960 start_codon:yes stop_codon:yes gene_type:complete
MKEYQSAPYLELEDYKAPKGINSVFIPMKDNKKLRLIYWINLIDDNKKRGTILLQQGHNEFIEKYFETIQELLNRGFNVICFDWRGQGLSEKMIDDKHKQYIEDFSIHDSDLEFIINEIIIKNFTQPLIGIGHSMGGHILLSSKSLMKKKFKALILSAPMLGFSYEKMLFALSGIASIFSNKESYFLGSKPNMGNETAFEDNELTSDPKRYARTQKLVRKFPNIRLWGVTNSWVSAVKNNLRKIRQESWLESIQTRILIINPLEDRVVNSKKTIQIANKLPICKIININGVQHEILMEKDKLRAIFWKHFDNFLSDIKI